MKTWIPVLLTIFLLGTAFAQAANDEPKPGPEMQKLLDASCGQWTFTGKVHPTPLGPARELKGKLVNRAIFNGFMIESTYYYEGQSAGAASQATEFNWYDPLTEKYNYLYCSGRGNPEQAAFALEGGVATYETAFMDEGKRYKLRGSETDLPDGSGFVRKEEISVDGNTWLPLQKLRFVRADTSRAEAQVIRELQALDKAMWQAIIRVDTESLNRIYADEFVGLYDDDGDGDDPVWTKERLLSALKAGTSVITAYTYDDVHVRVNGDTAAITGLVTVAEKLQGRDISGQHRFTSIWVRKPAGWQCMSENYVRLSSQSANAAVELTEAHEGLKRLAGNWTWKGTQVNIDAKDSPFGQGGAFMGKETSRVVMGGLFLQSRWEEDNPKGHMGGIAMTAYDPEKKCYVVHDYLNDGSVASGTFTIEGNVCKSLWTFRTEADETVLARITETFSPDWNRSKATWEVSTDNGKMWKYWATIAKEKAK